MVVAMVQLQDMAGKSQEERMAALLEHVKGRTNNIVYRMMKLVDLKDFYYNVTVDR